MVDDYYKQHLKEVEAMKLKVYQNDGVMGETGELVKRKRLDGEQLKKLKKRKKKSKKKGS